MGGSGGKARPSYQALLCFITRMDAVAITPKNRKIAVVMARGGPAAAHIPAADEVIAPRIKSASTARCTRRYEPWACNDWALVARYNAGSSSSVTFS